MAFWIWKFKVAISLSFFLCRWCTNADQMFKCDFNDLFTQILWQFIAKEVRDICTFMHTILTAVKKLGQKPSGWKVIQNCMLIVPFWKASGSYFGVIQNRKLSSFLSGKSWWSQNICLHQNTKSKNIHRQSEYEIFLSPYS